MRKYAAVIERGPNNYSAYVPDLPGCVTTGKTIEEIKTNIREAIELHLEGLMEDGTPVPEPSSVAIEVELPVQPSAV
jgi:predicted RNase H-like HicB family nuclease